MSDRASKESEVAREIADLAELDRESLIARWRAFLLTLLTFGEFFQL